MLLQTLRECELVPLSPSELESRVSAARCARGELLRALPAVLRALCTILLAQRQKLRQQPQVLGAPTNNKVFIKLAKIDAVIYRNTCTII